MPPQLAHPVPNLVHAHLVIRAPERNDRHERLAEHVQLGETRADGGFDRDAGADDGLARGRVAALAEVEERGVRACDERSGSVCGLGEKGDRKSVV